MQCLGRRADGSRNSAFHYAVPQRGNPQDRRRHGRALWGCRYSGGGPQASAQRAEPFALERIERARLVQPGSEFDGEPAEEDVQIGPYLFRLASKPLVKNVFGQHHVPRGSQFFERR